MDVNERIKEEQGVTLMTDGHEATCWGCGLRILLPAYALTFKCEWCGAITQGERNSRRPDSKCFSRWRRVRDWFFAAILVLFMLFVICGGVWAVHPVVFSISFSYGVCHCTITAILSSVTISSFCFAAFRSAGAPPNILWGSYPVVGKNGLSDYTFCAYCKKPKPPRAHHCRSCKKCVMDMDHHCPFIGNCVGAANHRFFIAFLISVVISCAYVVVITTYAAFYVWPPVEYGDLKTYRFDSMELLKEIVAALAASAFFLSARGFLLVYLAFAGLAVGIGISALLWQQLSAIYDGETYMDRITSKNAVHEERGCENLVRFFGLPYSVSRLLSGPTKQWPNSKIL